MTETEAQTGPTEMTETEAQTDPTEVTETEAQTDTAVTVSTVSQTDIQPEVSVCVSKSYSMSPIKKKLYLVFPTKSYTNPRYTARKDS